MKERLNFRFCSCRYEIHPKHVFSAVLRNYPLYFAADRLIGKTLVFPFTADEATRRVRPPASGETRTSGIAPVHALSIKFRMRPECPQRTLSTGNKSTGRTDCGSRKLPISLINWELSLIVRLPFGHIFTALIASVSASYRSRAALQLEILALRHQIGVLQRSVKRPKLTPADRLLWVWLATVWYDWKSRAFIMQASTVIGCHRKGFRLFWTWKIRRSRPGRPKVPKEVRELIRTMSREIRSGALRRCMVNC